MLIPVGSKRLDASAQIGDRAEGAAAHCALSDQAEPAFHLIQPGTVGRREVQMKAPTARQPCSDARMFVCGVVINDQMQIQVCRSVRLQMPQEGKKLLMSVARLALRDHLAV